MTNTMLDLADICDAWYKSEEAAARCRDLASLKQASPYPCHILDVQGSVILMDNFKLVREADTHSHLAMNAVLGCTS